MSRMEMEDPTTTSSLDGSISKLPGKLDRLLRHGCTLPKGVADEVPLIKGDLEKIVAISSDLEDDHAMTARCWRKEVRELSYDMEDFVDQYEHARAVTCSRSMIRGLKIATQQRRKSKTGLAWLREMLKQRLWMANKIREFSARTQEALQRYSLYNLDAIAGASASSRRTCAYSDPAWNSTPCGEENAYVGISDAMEELLMMMHDDHGHQKLKVVSIVGFGGIGKTTLAIELYRKLGQQYECRAFVRTSQKPDMRRIFISMLSQVRPHQPPDNWTVHSLISTIRTHLQDKRYLIIVEDLCTASTWDIVKYALPDSNCCSRILTTTEIEDLALQACDHDPKYVYKMKPLGEDNSRKLFFGSVFGPQHDCPPELREISCNIISKCGGMPLAIVTVASILSSRPGEGQWDYVDKSIGESLLTNPTWEGMKQVLDLNYNSLPQHLKACILYTGLYEEDIIIWKDDLVNQWIAEGFIQTTEEQDKKEIGRSFFDRLISGKLILPVDINRNGEVLSCVVHRMVLDLVIRDKSMEENFVTAIHHSQADTTLADKVRRLSLQFGNAEDATPPSNMRLSYIRTLAFLGVFKCLPSIVQFRLLQVLILHFWGDKDTISFDITTISELFRLRYFKVASNVTLELGTQMRCLQSLETLAIDARVSAVPSDIVQLPGLLHLSLPAQTNLLNGIGHMTSLRTLRYFDLSSNSLENVQSLSMLTNLVDLQLTCSTVEPESLNLKTRFLLNTVLEGLSNLKSLTLVPTRTSSYYTNSVDDDTGASVTCMTISDGFSTLSSAPPLLRSLEVSSRICIFLCTPKWIGQLHKLCILKFGVRKIDRDGVDVLRGLPALAVLSLYVHTKPAARIVIGKTGFPVIKYFKFKCCDPCLKFEEGAMPNLRKLKLAFNACNADQPTTMPVGINYLSKLKVVSAKIGGAGPEESHTRAAELAFRYAIRVHAGCQKVDVQLGRLIVGGEDDQSSQSSMTTAGYQQNQYPPSPAHAPGQKQNRHGQRHDSIPEQTTPPLKKETRQTTPVRPVLTSLPYYTSGAAAGAGRDGGRRLWVKERDHEWWDRMSSPACPEDEFRRAFRMSRATFEAVCEELGAAVAKEDTMLRAAIPVRQRAAVCIWRLATGEPLRLVSKRFGLFISTCHKLVLEVCAAIKAVLMPKAVQWPEAPDAAAGVSASFEAASGIPGVVGAMYTTHIPIIAPKANVAAYYNRRHTERNQKTSYSITVQGVVDAGGAFTDVCIGWPGSMSDADVLDRSAGPRACCRASGWWAAPGTRSWTGCWCPTRTTT